MMKRPHLLKESFAATLLLLLLAFCVSFIPFKFEFTKAIRQGFLGFDIYDLNYSGNHLKNQYRDTNIVIVEIENSRGAIAEQINILQKYFPAVIGIDAVFEKEREPLEDLKLVQAITQDSNVIIASKFDNDPTTGKPGFIHNFFEENEKQFLSGYINIIGSQYSVIRNYPPFLKTGDSQYLSFSSAIAKYFSPGKFNALKRRNNKMEIINYTGNIENYSCLSKEQILYADTTGQLRNLIPGKIVLLGFIDKESPLILEDLHFSPLNELVAGKSFPDMYGVMIHANILSMILKDNYKKQASDFVSYIFAGIITFLFVLFILSQYKGRNKHPKHGWLLLIQFFLIIVVLFIFLQVFSLFNYKVPLLPIMITLVLTVEYFELYKVIARWANKKFKYQTLFNHKD